MNLRLTNSALLLSAVFCFSSLLLARVSIAGEHSYSSLQYFASSSNQSSNKSASEWKKGHKSRVRIISGKTDFASHKSAYAGIQLQMSNGWKTYWRSPGDTGVPPSFDWSGSRNLEKITILWPAPQKYKDEYSTSIGYKHEVILPVKITARNSSEPVDIKLRFGYGICAEICVPVEAKMNLTITPRQTGMNSLLSRYRSMVPRSVKSIGKVVNGFSIRKVVVKLKGKKPGITIETSVPAQTKKAELYVEASKGFYLPLPKLQSSSKGNRHRFYIDLTKGDPPKELIGKTLAFTLVGDKAGIEYKRKIN